MKVKIDNVNQTINSLKDCAYVSKTITDPMSKLQRPFEGPEFGLQLL
jgi:uncharacterized protein YlbG (UPF0298 family)